MKISLPSLAEYENVLLSMDFVHLIPWHTTCFSVTVFVEHVCGIRLLDECNIYNTCMSKHALVCPDSCPRFVTPVIMNGFCNNWTQIITISR